MSKLINIGVNIWSSWWKITVLSLPGTFKPLSNCHTLHMAPVHRGVHAYLKKKKTVRRCNWRKLARILAPRALCVYAQGLLGSGVHGNQRKHRPALSSSASPFPGAAVAPKPVKTVYHGSQRGPLLRKDSLCSANYAQKVRLPLFESANTAS